MYLQWKKQRYQTCCPVGLEDETLLLWLPVVQLDWQSVVGQQFYCLPLQASYAVLAEESQAFFKHSPHTNCISNSAILRNNYILLLSDLCTCVHVKKKWRRTGSHSSSVSGSNCLVRLQIFKKKRWAGALLGGKCCCFVWKPSWKSHTNLCLVTFWFGTFTMLFSATGCVVHHENAQRWMVGCYNGL